MSLHLQLLRGRPGAWELRLRPTCGAADVWSPYLADLHWHEDGLHCAAYALFPFLARAAQVRTLRRRTARAAGRPGVRVARCAS